MGQTNRETNGLVGVGNEHQANKAGPSWPCGHTHSWGHLRSSQGMGPAEPSPALGQKHPEPMGWCGQRCTHTITNLHLHGLMCGPTLSHITPELTDSPRHQLVVCQMGKLSPERGEPLLGPAGTVTQCAGSGSSSSTVSASPGHPETWAFLPGRPPWCPLGLR